MEIDNIEMHFCIHSVETCNFLTRVKVTCEIFFGISADLVKNFEHNNSD